jgi:hypothetical protein
MGDIDILAARCDPKVGTTPGRFSDEIEEKLKEARRSPHADCGPTGP